MSGWPAGGTRAATATHRHQDCAMQQQPLTAMHPFCVFERGVTIPGDVEDFGGPFVERQFGERRKQGTLFPMEATNHPLLRRIFARLSSMPDAGSVWQCGDVTARDRPDARHTIRGAGAAGIFSVRRPISARRVGTPAFGRHWYQPGARDTYYVLP